MVLYSTRHREHELKWSEQVESVYTLLADHGYDGDFSESGFDNGQSDMWKWIKAARDEERIRRME